MKTGVKSSFSYFGPFQSCGTIGDWGKENAPMWHCGLWVGDFVTAWETTFGQ